MKSTTTLLRLPLYSCAVAAGFPSPADDYLDLDLNLNEYLIQNPSSTFCLRIQGTAMEGANMHDGDILIVDRSKRATSGRVVVALLNGELAVGRLLKNERGTCLAAVQGRQRVVPIPDDAEFQILGVVICTIYKQ